jgi:hypothetical protein
MARQPIGHQATGPDITLRCPKARAPMPDYQVDFSAPAELRKWPSLNRQRVSASFGARPYLIGESGTLDECIQQFMRLPEAQRHLYEPRRSPILSVRSCRRSTSFSWRGSRIFLGNSDAELFQ